MNFETHPSGHMAESSPFDRDLSDLINHHSLENQSDTPDFILSLFLKDCLEAFERATVKRHLWHEENHTRERLAFLAGFEGGADIGRMTGYNGHNEAEREEAWEQYSDQPEPSLDSQDKK